MPHLNPIQYQYTQSIINTVNLQLDVYKPTLKEKNKKEKVKAAVST